MNPKLAKTSSTPEGFIEKGNIADSLSMDRRIQIVISAIEADLARLWNIDELARLVNLSTSRLRHLFKAETGKTLAQHLKNVRLREAETLLRTTFLSVKEVMNRVGIADESHFSHEFKKKYGLAPSKYRRAVTVTTLAKE